MGSQAKMVDPFVNQPKNFNLLQETRFQFILARAPTVSYFCQKAKIPSLSVGTLIQPTPFINIPRPNGKMEFNDLYVTFKVDEDLRNYSEIFNWMVGIGFPDGTEDYTAMTLGQAKNPPNVYSDATMTILNSAQGTNFLFKFVDMFPIGLEELDFDITVESPQFIECTAMFRYRRFYIEKR